LGSPGRAGGLPIVFNFAVKFGPKTEEEFTTKSKKSGKFTERLCHNPASCRIMASEFLRSKNSTCPPTADSIGYSGVLAAALRALSGLRLGQWLLFSSFLFYLL
jgi:hypothetical protein